MPRVGIIDYQAGNIRSIANAFEHLGAQVLQVREPADMAGASHLLLPGVGAFGYCAQRLHASGLLPAISDWTLTHKKPILGICVGMQLLADSSSEMGLQQGLGWIGGQVRQIRSDPPQVRVPHVGWNTATFALPFGSFAAGDAADFYFDHSYAYLQPRLGQALALCQHGGDFCAALVHDNLVAAQFHPEKSQAAGMRFLQAFLQMVPSG
ncbi:MAG: imidazole glycerol phosphate synthase subunit HisH [Burkholderiaceae bacterium]